MGLLSSLSSFQHKHVRAHHVPSSNEWPMPTYTSPYIAVSWCHPRTPNTESFLWEDGDGPVTRPVSSPTDLSVTSPSVVGHSTLQGHSGSDSLQTQVGQMSQDWTRDEASPGGDRSRDSAWSIQWPSSPRRLSGLPSQSSPALWASASPSNLLQPLSLAQSAQRHSPQSWKWPQVCRPNAKFFL